MADLHYHSTRQSSIKAEWHDATSFMSDATTLVDDEDDWDAVTLIDEDAEVIARILTEDEVVVVPSERPITPPIRPVEGRRLVSRIPRMEYEDDKFFGDTEVPLVPAMGRLEDLIRIHRPATQGQPHSAPVPRAVDDSNAGQPSELRLDEAMTPAVQEHIARARRQEYHTSRIPPVRHRNETLDEFMLRLRAHREYNTHYMLGAGQSDVDLGGRTGRGELQRLRRTRTEMDATTT